MPRSLWILIGVALGVGCRGGARQEAKDEAVTAPGAPPADAAPADAAPADAAIAIDDAGALDPTAGAPATSEDAGAADRSPLAVRLQRIRAGQASIAALIDPAAGLVVRDHLGAHRACGAALPLFIEAIDVALAGGTAPTCDRATCRFQVRSPISYDEPNVALGFTGTPPRLEAAVWQEPATRGAVSSRDVTRALRAAGPACPAAAAYPVVPPAPPGGPAATKAWMREIADGKVAATALVDPALGIVVASYQNGEQDPRPKPASRRLCGEAAIRELERRRPALRTTLADEDDNIFHCSNRPAPTCVVGAIGEYMSTSRYRFRATGAALVIDTILDVDSTYAPFDEAPVLARLRARQLGGTCPL